VWSCKPQGVSQHAANHQIPGELDLVSKLKASHLNLNLSISYVFMQNSFLFSFPVQSIFSRCCEFSGTLDLDMQALATTIFLRRNKRNPKLPTAMHWSGEDCTNVAHRNAFCTKNIQFWKMSFRKKWTQFQQEIQFFTLPTLKQKNRIW
jgi:hypothetical protein